MVGLIVTGQWTKLRHLLKRQLTRPSYLNRALGLDFVSRQRELRVVPEPVLLRPHSVSTATTTGINVEEGRVTRLRHRTQTLASETNTAPTPEGLAGGHLAARNRAAAPAGKQRVEKELKRRQKELKKKENEILEWSELYNSQVNESYLGGDSLFLFPSPPPVVEAVTTLYIPGNADEYEGWEISNEDAFLEASLRYDKREDPDVPECLGFGSIASDVRVCDLDWRKRILNEKKALKRAKGLDGVMTHSAWPVHSEKRNTRKRHLREKSSHRLDRFVGLDGFEDLDRFDDARTY